MAIKFTWAKLPVDSEGKSYDSLDAFQAAQIEKVMQHPDSSSSIWDNIVAHKAEIIEILELTMDARPTARGVKKPRKPKADAQPELPKVA